MAVSLNVKANGKVSSSLLRILLNKNHPSKISAYFEVVTCALHHGDRAIVLSYLRTSFKIFLERLNIVKVDLSYVFRRSNSLFAGSTMTLRRQDTGGFNRLTPFGYPVLTSYNL